MARNTMNSLPKLAFNMLLSLLAIAFLGGAARAQTQAAPAPATPAQATYQPKFRGDPAKSEAESQTLGYMRTVVRAEKIYFKRRNEYAPSLLALAGHGSFTRRMAHDTHRGDYTIRYRAKKVSYELSAIPQQIGPDHRAFYANEDGKIRVEEDKPAGPKSPVLK